MGNGNDNRRQYHIIVALCVLYFFRLYNKPEMEHPNKVLFFPSIIFYTFPMMIFFLKANKANPESLLMIQTCQSTSKFLSDQV